jgi:paraquat-inducible protein B
MECGFALGEAVQDKLHQTVKTKLTPAVVGAFVIGAFALGVLALLTFGGFSIFEKPERFVVYFNESIHGLDLGSAVKLRGVRVGRVTALNIRYDIDNAKNRSVVAVVCELNKDMVTDLHGKIIDVSSRGELEKLVQKGLRAKLEVAGLATGLLFVNLDFLEPGETVDETSGTHDRYVVVPSVRSAISEFQKGIGEILANVKGIDLAALAKDISALANTARKQIDGVDLRGLADQWKKTGVQFEAMANNPEFKKTFDNLNGAVADLRGTIAKLDAQIEPAGKELTATLAEARKTVQSFQQTAAAAQGFIAAHSSVGADLGETMEHLNEAADAVKRLADYLERNPNALITGRRRPQ